MGQVYRHKESLSGWLFIVKITKYNVTISYLFWNEQITYQTLDRKYFEVNYILHDGEKMLNSTTKARYDHEKMRRLNKL